MSILIATVWLVMAGLASPPQAVLMDVKTGRLSGQVVDPSGNPVSGATVRITGEGQSQTIVSDTDGRFSRRAAGRLLIVATAPGFSDASKSIALQGGEELEIRLVLGFVAVSERVTVTAAAPGPSTETAGALSTVASDVLERRGGQALDDLLKRVPGFSLFRANSSRVANPTSQGVSLRGLGPSGASRALALADGTVLNDPFGGWIYWNRVPAASIHRVEVARGGGGDRFGTDALGGVLQVVTLAANAPRVRGEVNLGTGDSARASVFLAHPLGRWHPSIALDVGQARGYPVVARDQRGVIDQPAGGQWASAVAAVSRARDDGTSATLRANAYGESRQNGTPLQQNSTRIGELSFSMQGFAAGGVWRAGAGFSRQRYRQTFTAVASDRARETLTRTQVVPAGSEWAGLSWGRGSRRLSLQGSGEWRRTHGTSREAPVVNGISGTVIAVGGRQHVFGAAAQASLDAGRGVSLDAAGRVDRWQIEADGGGARRSGSQVSPRAGASWQATPVLSVRASSYRSFRAPTLNERYRGFRVGNIVTRANEALRPEVLTGVDLGVRLAWSKADVRVVGFANRLTDPVTNVTLETGSVIVRERRNLGRITARGAEVEGQWRVAPGARLHASMLLIDSRIGASAQASLDGRRTPLVPQVTASFGATVALPAALRLAVDLRFLGSRYEDDRNQLPVRRSLVGDLWLTRPLSRRTSLALSVENVANTEYEVGRTPLRLVGLPRVAHLGVRYGY